MDQKAVARCPYCLKQVSAAETTIDHVIARSWFPAGTTNVAKWKIRCCRDCNNEKSVFEQDVLGRLAWCLDPSDPTLADIIKKARRSVDPRSATSARDAMHRFNKREALRRDVVDIASKTEPGVLPYFVDNFDGGSRTGIAIPSGSLDELIKKWVRGIHMCEISEIIPVGYDVSVIHVGDQARPAAIADISKHAKIVQKRAWSSCGYLLREGG